MRENPVWLVPVLWAVGISSVVAGGAGAYGAWRASGVSEREERERQERVEAAQATGREQEILSSLTLEQMQPYLLLLIPVSVLGAAALIAKSKVKDRKLRERLLRQIELDEEYGY